MNRGKALSALQALAHEARLDLVHLLMPHGDAGLSAGEIGRALNMPASRLSFHLAALEQAGLLQSRKLARHVFYAVNTVGIGGTIGYLLNECCRADPVVRACCHTTTRPLPAPDTPLPDETGPG